MTLAASLNDTIKKGLSGSTETLRRFKGRFNRDGFDRLARSPTTLIPRPGRKPIQLATDRVRARPAVSPQLSYLIGTTAIGLGVWGTFFPRSVNRFLGSSAPLPAVRTLFGLRELWSGYSLAGDPTRSHVLWARVAADVADLAVLGKLNHPANPRRSGARAALGFVILVTALDVVTAVRMTGVRRNCE